MKKMKKIIITLIVTVLFVFSLNAQNDVDALRYSNISFGGTARYMGAGGAFGALGADFSSLSVNPAGIGLYKKSEFTFSPALYRSNIESKYNGTTGEDSKMNFNLSNFGLVFSSKTKGKYSEGKGWKNAQFGIGINRIANFNSRMMIEGYNGDNSIMAEFVSKAQGSTPGNLNVFDTYLAYQTFMINPVGDSTLYTSPLDNGGITQRKTITTKGGINEFVLAFGGNYNDKLYLGATFGIPFVRYIEESVYEEKDYDNNTAVTGDFESFMYNQQLKTTGVGINFKFGFIYRPLDFIRFGASVHTPTYYSLNDEYENSMESNFDNGDHFYAEPDKKGEFDYEVETPLRFTGSLAFIIGKYGFIGLDYEYADISEASLRSDDYNFASENRAVRDKYDAQNIIRVGGELRLNPMFVRAGVALYESPYISGVNSGGEKTYYTFGLGFRDGPYFIDLAYVFSKSEEDYYLYNPELVNATNNNITSGNFVITLGVKF